MIVQVKAVSRRTTQQAQLLFQQRAAELKQRIGEKIAERIVADSPVDTGTYIMAHVAGTAESSESATRSSAGKLRGRNPAQFKNLALGNLKRSVASAAVMAGNEIWFRNRAEHAAAVEYLGWKRQGAYHVYANARAYGPTAVREAAREMGMETR
jgi:hypothetical protein